jgi:endonuclease YncB( thermonuclease family)
MGICNCKQYYNIHQLSKCTNKMPLFSFNGKKCYAKIVDVYDGDTFKACIYHNNKVIKINCRTLGYDSPEIKPRLNINNRDEHIANAKLARDFFKESVGYPHGLVYLHCHKYEKYGRVLVTVYKNKCSQQSINNIMISEGHGVPYDGGKKAPI